MSTTVREFVIRSLQQFNQRLNTLPAVTSTDNGKVLKVVNGEWTLVSPSQIYSGSGTPNNAQGNNGDIYIQT